MDQDATRKDKLKRRRRKLSILNWTAACVHKLMAGKNIIQSFPVNLDRRWLKAGIKERKLIYVTPDITANFQIVSSNKRCFIEHASPTVSA